MTQSPDVRTSTPPAPSATQIAAQSLEQLDARRSELRNQLVSLTVRRDLLTQQLRNADQPGQAQLQAQLKDIGERTNRVNAELNAIDDAADKVLRSGPVVAPPLPGAPQEVPMIAGPDVAPNITVMPGGDPGMERLLRKSMALDGAGFALLLLAVFLWGRRPRRSPKLAVEDSTRIDQLQRAVDVIAVEVERISESQRYLTKVLSENRALGAGAADELPLKSRDAERVERKL